jgi:hypothetical protein
MGTSLPKLIFNHPFLFFLRNTETEDILFAGRMSEPEVAKQPAVGSLTDSQLSELTQGIFTSRPGLPVVPSNTYNHASSSGNAYRPAPLLPSGTLNSNSNIPVPQTQPTITNYYSSPRNINTGNIPSSMLYQSYPTQLQTRSVGNSPSQPNTAQYQPNGNTATFQTSNAETDGTQYSQAPMQLFSTSGSHASATISAQYRPSAVNESPEGDSVASTNHSYNDRIHFSP